MRLKNPNQFAACYSMDIYCDQMLNPFEHLVCETLIGETFGQCVREANKKGWVIHKDRTATCPHCSRKKNVRTK